MQTIRTTFVSDIFRQFGSFLNFLTLQHKHNYTYIVGKYNMCLNSLRNRPEKLTNGSPFYLFLKLVQIYFIFPNKVYVHCKMNI
jgi:hypothetical protein